MTEHTINLVKEFMNTKSFTYVPGIIIGMQEEDNVAGVLHFKNCFRILRNIAAHQPAVLVEQIDKGVNKGNSKIVFKAVNEGEPVTVVLDMVQFTVWMFDMYKHTNESAYLIFWYGLMTALYPSMLSVHKRSKEKFSFDVKKHGGLYKLFVDLQEFEYKEFGTIKALSIEDPYYVSLYKGNPQLFWKIAFPDMVNILKLFVSGVVDWMDMGNIDGFITLYKEREGA